MRELDRVTAVKANLELLILDNENLLEQFSNVISQLEEIETLPNEEKYARFREMESKGAFKLNGIDIRLFAKTTNKPLPPHEFLIRTRRRLQNTVALVRAFVEKGLFQEGEALRGEMEQLIAQDVDEHKNKDVIEFKDTVEALRESAGFQNYQSQKTTFLKQDPQLKAEADFLSSKEAVTDGEQVARAKEEELNEIQEKLDLGELSAQDAQELLDKLDESKSE
jgi:hypothetical protein